MLHFFKNWKKVLVLLVLLGAPLRVYHLGEASFVADEFLDINASYGYFQTGEWQAWDFNSERPESLENSNAARDERASAYKWQVAQLFHFFPPTETTARLVSVLWGMISLVLVFFMTTYFWKKKEIGLIASFLYAVSITALTLDRRLRMYAMFVPVFLAFSWMLYLVLEEKYTGTIRWIRAIYHRTGYNIVYLIPAVLLGSMSLHLHLLTVNIAFIVLVYALCMAVLVRQPTGGIVQWNKYTVIIAGFLLSVIGLKVASPSAFELLTSSFVFPENHYSYFGIALKDYEHALLALLLFAFALFHIIAHREKSKAGLWIVSSFLTPLLLAVFAWDRNVGEQYISFVQPFKMMIMAYGVYSVASFAEKHVQKGKCSVFAVAIALLLILLPHYSAFFGEDTLYRQTSQSDNPQYKKVFAYFLKNKTAEDIVVTRDLRDYYLSGAHVHVENIGGERTKDKLTLERLVSIVEQYQTGWVILSDNDDVFVSKDAMLYIEKNMERVSHSQVRGKISVYRWGIR